MVVKFLGETYSPFQIVFFSTLFGFPIVTVMLMRDREDGNLRPRHPWWTRCAPSPSVITTSSAFYAFSVLPLAQTYAIIFAAPLLITILAIPILGENVGWRRSLAVTVGLIGVLVVLRPGATALSAGHLAALAAAVFSAIAAVIVRKIGSDERSAVLLLYPMMANFVLMGCAMPFVYQPMPPPHLGGFALIAILGFCGGALPHRGLSPGERRGRRADAVFPDPLGGASTASSSSTRRRTGTPASAPAIIIASGVYVVFREERPNVSKNRPVLATTSRYVGRHLSADLDAVPVRAQALKRAAWPRFRPPPVRFFVAKSMQCAGKSAPSVSPSF